MPELPEVETVKRSLEPYLLNRKIVAIEVLREKSFPDLELMDNIIGKLIVKVNRRAKIIDLVFENQWHLLTHLKMTGQLLYLEKENLAGGGHPTNDVLLQLPGKHTRIIYKLDNQARLLFNDMRVFGWMKIFGPDKIESEWLKYGPDANEKVSVEYLRQAWKNKAQAIKVAMMENKVWAGIGNIYASEILFSTGIMPDRPAKNLTNEEIALLIEKACFILDEATEAKGTTFDGKYVDALGRTGNYWSQLKVYGRENEVCLKCGAKIKNMKLAGRASFYCERCQK